MSKPMKRSATTELNSDNWDIEDEPEEPGTFKTVGKEELSKRVMKVARRRLRQDQQPIFTNFSGFGKAVSSVPDVKSTFSFLSNLNGSHSQTTNQPVPVSSNKDNENKNEDTKASKESEYLSSIKSLNECLMDWLNKCIQKNPSCILTPIFRDYEKHLDSLKPVSEKSQEPKSTESFTGFKFNIASTANSQTSSSNTSVPQPQFTSTLSSFSNSTSATTTTTSGSWLSSSPICNTNVFSNNKPMFNFSSTPSSVAAPQSESSEKDEEDETPVNDFKPVTEEDALYSQRVKVFFKNGKDYSDMGVGTLYIKETKDPQGNKVHQAIVRADTNLGNIILNIRITSDMPTKRVGKNNVMVVSPSSDANSKTKDSKSDSASKFVPVLLRVKTGDEADKLLNEINKYK